MKQYTISYAQNREDVILDAFFSDITDGFYVDVGANHPEHDSVTKLFYEKGWHGINIEPNKSLFDLLEAERPEDINLNIGVSDKPGKLKFREYQGFGNGLSTFSDAMKKEYATVESDMTQHTRNYKDRTVDVKTLEQVFEDYKTETINFLKVDVEGYEYEALKGNDWTKYRPEIICIEANHVDHDWHPLLAKADYRQVFFDGINEYFLAKEHPEIEKRFSYRLGILGRPILPLELKTDFGDIEILNKRLEADRQELNRRIGEKDKLIFHLSQELEAQQRLKPQLSRLARTIDAAILRRLKRLDRSAAPSSRRRQVIPVLPSGEATKLELMAITETNDLENFYKGKSRSMLNPRQVLYSVTLAIYMAFRSLGKSSARFMLKVLRKLRSRHV